MILHFKSIYGWLLTFKIRFCKQIAVCEKRVTRVIILYYIAVILSLPQLLHFCV